MTPEGKIKKTARDAARDLGFYTFPINQQGIGRRGIPDDFICVNGHSVLVEFKAHMVWEQKASALKTLPTMLQAKELWAHETSGGLSLVVDDTTLDNYISWLQYSLWASNSAVSADDHDRYCDSLRYARRIVDNHMRWSIPIERYQLWRNKDPLIRAHWCNSSDGFGLPVLLFA